MPPKKKTVKAEPRAARSQSKLKAKATAKNTTRVTTVVNVAAPRKRASRAPTKRPAAPAQPQLIYQQPPVYLPQPLVFQNGPYEMRQAAVLEDIKREVASLKAPKEPVTPPVMTLNPTYDLPPSPAPSVVAERAVAQGAPSAAPPPRLARPRWDEPNTIMNPETGAMIRIGSTTYKKLVRRGVIPRE